MDKKKDCNKKLGQYFTKNKELKEKLYEFILNDPEVILEPSIGRGDLIDIVKSKRNLIKFDMYEIDKEIKMLETVNMEEIIYGDFLEQKIEKKYKTIIGNPPYIRTKKGNLYIDFTEKCYNLLDENGELIFIVPSDFFKLTSSAKLLKKMMENGAFTHIYHPNNENLFDNASIDVIIYRYNKNKEIEKKVIYNGVEMKIINSDGLITFSEKEEENKILFKDYFDIYVGMVSGKDDVYKNNEIGNIEILNGKDKIEKYIYVNNYPSENEQINKLLMDNKDDLITRGIKKFNEKNWFEWGALRNMATIEKNKGKECIYIYNLTRKTEISFVDKVKYFGGGLIMLLPKVKCNLKNISEYINSDSFKTNFMFSGRCKIGHRQISNASIPIKYFEE